MARCSQRNRLIDSLLGGPSAAHQQKYHDQHDESQSAAWVVAPSPAVGPGRQRADEEDHENEKKQS